MTSFQSELLKLCWHHGGRLSRQQIALVLLEALRIVLTSETAIDQDAINQSVDEACKNPVS